MATAEKRGRVGAAKRIPPCCSSDGGLSPVLQKKNPPCCGFCCLSNRSRISLRDSGMTHRQRRALRARADASLDLAFLVDHVLADDGVVFLDFHLVRGVLLVLVGGVEVAGAGRGSQADLVAFACHGSSPYTFSPRARRSLSTASMPFLSMVRRALPDTRSFTQRFSLATQNRRSCRLGSQRRRVLLLACETLLPVVAPLPVTWHTRAMAFSSW